MLLLGLLELLSVLNKDARLNAQQGKLVAQKVELGGFDARFQQGELVGNLNNSVWTTRQRRSRTIFMEMHTSVGSGYYPIAFTVECVWYSVSRKSSLLETIRFFR